MVQVKMVSRQKESEARRKVQIGGPEVWGTLHQGLVVDAATEEGSMDRALGSASIWR